MAIITRLDRKFDVRLTVTVGGKLIERRRRGISTKGEARRIEEELKGELFSLKQKGWTKVVTWKDALSAYSEWKEKKVAYSTLTSAKGILQLHTAVWMSRPIDSFRTVEIESLVENAYNEESMESKRKLLGYIKDVFKRQIHFGNLGVNPCADLSYSKGAEKELIAMNQSEIQMLLGKARSLNHPWHSIWAVIYNLGLRSGEGLALKWTDIDFTTNRVSINKSYCSKLKKIGPTKSRKSRTVPMNSTLAALLRELKLTGADSEYVLPQLTDWKRGDAAEILRTFQRDLGIRQTNFHSLRASFITHLLLKRIPVHVVQAMVGHADLKTTQRYVRFVGSDLDGATDALASELSSNNLAEVLQIFKEP